MKVNKYCGIKSLSKTKIPQKTSLADKRGFEIKNGDRNHNLTTVNVSLSL